MTGSRSFVPSGIAPLDDRTGGLQAGGTYLLVGAPGPEKLVAALQFVHAGILAGERCAFVTNADAEGALEVAAAWGFDLRAAWESGQLVIVGFKDDFELRAIRSIAPEEVVEELDYVLGPDLDRIAVDPGAMFLVGGARTLLGSTFLAWARGHEATSLVTFSVDGGATSLPSSADWLINATTARLLLEKRGDGLYQVTVARAMPEPGRRDETVSLELQPGGGLVQPTHYPARRGVDRGGIDENRLLLVSLGSEHTADLEAWAKQAFETDVVTEPFDAVAKVQSGASYGGVLIHTARTRSREALQACRALRPLTRAAIVLASDDAVRSTDRIKVLEAGADDFLSGGLDFRELGLRIRHAIARGATPFEAMTDDGEQPDSTLIPADSDGGRVPLDTFRAEVERRAANPDYAFFCVLDIRSDSTSPDDLARTCAESVRSDEGDIVTAATERCAVLLQGAREGQLGPFLDRLRARLSEAGNGDGGVEIDVLSHPSEADRIMAVLGSTGASAA
jgi:CheY-like chemotaxis protein